ncbi:hydrogen peroxide-inducible genes activator [Hyphomonas sp. FCG-A18]|uniref:LysR family transcriptional regulator n=1 Tax=Hyphomonas sp. FCG-A18 TaxID=3080019 RepID=UPI002B29A4F8|nr:hydrogen peroxide-inducible genes activator [Hyphomonas sp. FCG-A18]
MKPTLRQLQYLVAIAETGRFGEAARKVHVSQPSLSAQIADMEAMLGTQLVERGRQGSILTPAGEEVLRRARVVLKDMDDLKAAAKQYSGDMAGRVRLGVLPSIGPYLLPMAARRLHSLFPALKLSVREESRSLLMEKVNDGRFDLILTVEGKDDGLLTHDILTEHLYACVAPDAPLAQETGPITAKDLKDQVLLTLGQNYRLSKTVRDLAEEVGAHISDEYEGTSLDALRQMAAMGAGVAILPSLYAASETRRDDGVVVRRVDLKTARRDVELVWRTTTPLGTVFESFAKVLSEEAHKLVAE